jgi:transposase
MMQLTAQTRILLSVDPADFRAGIDGLCRVCRAELAADPFSGTVFVFRNRRGTSVKLLAYDGQGFWLCQKRLSSGSFRYWPDRSGSSARIEMLAHELQVLLMGGDPEASRAAPLWRPIMATTSAVAV